MQQFHSPLDDFLPCLLQCNVLCWFLPVKSDAAIQYYLYVIYMWTSIIMYCLYALIVIVYNIIQVHDSVKHIDKFSMLLII